MVNLIAALAYNLILGIKLLGVPRRLPELADQDLDEENADAARKLEPEFAAMGGHGDGFRSAVMRVAAGVARLGFWADRD